MKKLRKTFVILITTLVLLTSFFAIGGFSNKKVSALPPKYDGSMIYYFTDYYPTLTREQLETEFNYATIFFDHQYVDFITFCQMVENGYFYGFSSDCMVIIDIKSFKFPYTFALYDLFYELSENQNCYTVFISPFDYSNLNEESNFLQYVDTYAIDSNFERLKTYIHNIFTLRSTEHYAANDTYIIDGRLLNLKNYNSMFFDDVCESSPILKILLNEMYKALRVNPNDYTYSNFINYYGIGILAHTDTNNFLDLGDGGVYSINNFDELLDGEPKKEEVVLFGFWSLEPTLYQFIQWTQSSGYDNFFVYVLEVEPIEEVLWGGIDVFTEEDVRALLGTEEEIGDIAYYLLYCLRDYTIRGGWDT